MFAYLGGAVHECTRLASVIEHRSIAAQKCCLSVQYEELSDRRNAPPKLNQGPNAESKNKSGGLVVWARGRGRPFQRFCPTLRTTINHDDLLLLLLLRVRKKKPSYCCISSRPRDDSGRELQIRPVEIAETGVCRSSRPAGQDATIEEAGHAQVRETDDLGKCGKER